MCQGENIVEMADLLLSCSSRLSFGISTRRHNCCPVWHRPNFYPFLRRLRIFAITYCKRGYTQGYITFSRRQGTLMWTIYGSSTDICSGSPINLLPRECFKKDISQKFTCLCPGAAAEFSKNSKDVEEQ